jgi:hypothetical protein
MPPPEMWQCFKTSRRRRARFTLGVANKSQSSVNAAFCDGYHIVSATAALSGVENVRGALIPNIFGSIASDRGGHGGITARKSPCPSGARLVDCSTCCQPEGRGYRGVVHEEDLSIKCGQSVSESKTTRAARSRECATSSQCGGSVASDSSVARGNRPSAVRNPTQIGAIGLRVTDGDLIATVG